MNGGTETDSLAGPTSNTDKTAVPSSPPAVKGKSKSRDKDKDKDKDTTAASKRRCVSTACIACRRRKSKCDGNLPKCAACASVYLTECEYAPHTDHRRKGVYKKDVDNVKTKNSSLQILFHAILNLEEEDAFDLVREIRTCENLEDLAHNVENRGKGIEVGSPDSPIYGGQDGQVPQFEAELSGRMGDLVIDGSVKFIGGTSNLIWLNDSEIASMAPTSSDIQGAVKPRQEAVLDWTTITKDKDLILHFLNMYFCWHYAYFTTLSKELFYKDFLAGVSSQYCSRLLVNVMLALGCHFSSRSLARADPDDSSTTGDHFFAEAKRLLHENDEFATPKLCTVQALALMSVREAGCGRESKGWVYSGMSFRMASDLGLNIETEPMTHNGKLTDEEVDARRITYWGCFFFDKCWSNYLGRQPQLPQSDNHVKKPDVFGFEDSEMWSPYTDSGVVHVHTQPARTRAVALEILKLAEISSDLLASFYQPQHLDKPLSKQAELKKLSDLHTRLEAWKRDLPTELDPKDGQLPQVLLMHMFYQLLYIHLYRPFLKYTKTTSPLPAHISPRKFCTQAAGAISKLFRLYKRTHGLRQICNIAVYIAHSACTIHLLNLPDKNARRDIIHGVKQLEEIGECWMCARRTLRILDLCAEKWNIDLPDEVQGTFGRMRARWGSVDLSHSAASPGAMPTMVQDTHMSIDSDLGSDRTYAKPRQVQGTQPRTNDQSINSSMGQKQVPVMTAPSPTQNLKLRPMVQLPVSNQPLVNMGPALNRMKSFTQLTQAQQEAWNAHQARMAQMAKAAPRTTSGETRKNAAVLFGGVDSLIEESQDWWLNDQSQIAMGFDNWNSPSSADWSQTSGGLNLGMNNDVTSTPQATSSFFDGNMLQSGYTNLPRQSPTSNGYVSSQQQQMQQRLHQQNISPDLDGMAQNLANRSTQKRSAPFNDEMFY